MSTPTRRIDMKTALKDWKGKSYELWQWLIQHNVINRTDKYNHMQLIKLWLNYRAPYAATFADADLFKVALNDKRFIREATRNNNNDNSWQIYFNTMENQNAKRIARAARKTTVDDNNFSNFFRALTLANGDLHDLHNTTITVDDDHRDIFAEHFKDLLYKTNPKDAHILIQFDAELPSGTEVQEIRRFNLEDIESIINIIENMGIENEEDVGYELGKITKFADVNRVTIIDIDQLPLEMRPGKRRTPAFFSWLIKHSPFDLSRYQIYENIEDIDTELCFIHSLRMQGVDPSICDAISLDLKNIKTVTLKTVEHIADKYHLHINVKAVYEDKTMMQSERYKYCRTKKRSFDFR